MLCLSVKQFVEGSNVLRGAYRAGPCRKVLSQSLLVVVRPCARLYFLFSAVFGVQATQGQLCILIEAARLDFDGARCSVLSQSRRIPH